MEFKTDRNPTFESIGNAQVSRLMQQVILALLPGTFVMIWFFGWGVVTNIVLAVAFALFAEALMLKLRQRPIRPFVSDYSAVVTAWLLGVSLPAFSSWWLILIAIVFAIVIAKHLYGGLGYNPFNPAMVGYAVVLISFPVEMTQWAAPTELTWSLSSIYDALNLVFGGMHSEHWDAMTMATPLDQVKTSLVQGITVAESMQSESFGLFAGKGWEWVSLAFLVGGVWMIYRRIISWQIPIAFLGTLLLISGVFWLIDSAQFASPLFHLLSGATMLGAFFIATDPVSASTTPRGKLIYAAGIALSVYVIRVWGGYPDAVAFAVIIMNMAVPLIDYYTQPRIFGDHHG